MDFQERLKASYRLATEALESSNRSRHWESFHQNRDYSDYDLNYFRSNSHSSTRLSKGLDDASGFEYSLFSDVEEYVGYDNLYSNLENSNIGSCDFSYLHRGKFVDRNLLIHIAWLHEIKPFLSDLPLCNLFEAPLICDIGGGFGSFASLIYQSTRSKLLLVDLPESNLLTAFYLDKKFPGSKFFLFSDYINNGSIVTAKSIIESDFIVLPPGCNLEPEVTCSMFINTRSMMEMEPQIIKSYFDLIHDRLMPGGLFLNTNRYCKNKTGHVVRIADYPYDAKWAICRSEHAYKQPHIHSILTKRLVDDHDDIREELERIAKLGAPYYVSMRQHVFMETKTKIKRLIVSKLRSIFNKL